MFSVSRNLSGLECSGLPRASTYTYITIYISMYISTYIIFVVVGIIRYVCSSKLVLTWFSSCLFALHIYTYACVYAMYVYISVYISVYICILNYKNTDLLNIASMFYTNTNNIYQFINFCSTSFLFWFLVFWLAAL